MLNARSPRVRATLAAAAFWAAGGLFGGGPATAQPAPTLAVEASATTVGAPVVVRGEGWPAARLAQVQVCGNQARRGSPDCDQGRAVTVPVEGDGSFATVLTLAVPPVACPCVVRATSAGGPQAVVVPISLDGTSPAARVVDPADGPDRRLEITRAELAGGGPWTAWFGAPPRRTVTFTVRNVGNVVVTDPAFTMAVGRGEHPSGLVDVPRLGSLAPGEERAFVVAVDFGPAAFGAYTVRGDVTGLDQPAGFRVRGSVHPWLGVVSVAAVAQLVLLGWRNRLRSRLVPTDDGRVKVEVEVEVEAPAVAAVGVVAVGEPDWVRDPDDDGYGVDFDFDDDLTAFERRIVVPEQAPEPDPVSAWLEYFQDHYRSRDRSVVGQREVRVDLVVPGQRPDSVGHLAAQPQAGAPVPVWYDFDLPQVDGGHRRGEPPAGTRPRLDEGLLGRVPGRQVPGPPVAVDAGPGDPALGGGEGGRHERRRLVVQLVGEGVHVDDVDADADDHGRVVR